MYIMGKDNIPARFGSKFWTATYKFWEVGEPDRLRDEWSAIWSLNGKTYEEYIPADSMTEQQLRQYIMLKYILLRGES